MPSGIYKRKPFSIETRRKMSENNKGRFFSLETRKKISESHQGEKSHWWKGDNIGYSALHKWIKKELGKAIKCNLCGATDKIINWSNKNHTYKRNVKDWWSLCCACHSKYDKEKNGKYNKKKHI